MTAPPDRIWLQTSGDYEGASAAMDEVTWCDQPMQDGDHEYLLRDGPTMQAAIAAAEARGLRKAAESLLECSVWCDSQERTNDGWRNGVTDARKHYMARILALIPAPPPADGYAEGVRTGMRYGEAIAIAAIEAMPGAGPFRLVGKDDDWRFRANLARKEALDAAVAYIRLAFEKNAPPPADGGDK
jgi:hypothetical protein